jgi:hypothetical protein
MASISLRLVPDEYVSFVRAIPNEERLPSAFHDWIESTVKKDAHYCANGEVIKEIVIHYEPFAKYCQSTGRQPSYEMLMAYSVALAAGMQS